MPSRVKAWLGSHDVIGIVGLVFLWPCLQASGFYPLTINPSIGEISGTMTAYYHLMYSVVLIALIVAAIALRRRIEPVLGARSPAIAVCGALGCVCSVILMFADPTGAFPVALIVISECGIAVFMAAFVLLWGYRMAQGDVGRIVSTVAVAFLISQIVLVIYHGLALPSGVLLCICPAGTAICAYFSDAGKPREAQFEFKSLKGLPWGMMLTAVFLVYFGIIFVRLLVGDYSGDSSSWSKFISAAVGALIIAVVLALSHVTHAENKLFVLFALLVIVYVVALTVMVLLWDSAGLVARRVLVASEHCMDVFLFIVCAHAASRRRLSCALVFGIYALLVVAISWVLSFDLFYLSGLSGLLSSDALLQPGVILALLVAAVSAIAFLASYAVKLEKKVSEQATEHNQDHVASVLEGLGITPREMEVAALVYRGYGAKKIAETLYLSESTVKVYTSRVYSKLGIHSKQEFIDYVDERLADVSGI